MVPQDVTDFLRKLVADTEKDFIMNPFVRQSLIFVVEFYISHEAAIEAHLANPNAKKVAQDVLAGCKLLLPLLQAA